MNVQEPYDWIIRFSAEVLLIFTFALVLLPSLWKLAISRPGLIIVFSRSFGNFCQLIGDLPGFVTNYMLQIWTNEADPPPAAFIYPVNGIYRTVMVVQHTHNLALAVNRAHAMFFPFHYKFVYSKKRNVYIICLCLWLFAIFAAVFHQVLQSNLIYQPQPTLLITQYSTYASGVVYAALGCRMVWMKYKSKTVSASAEKDSVRILIVCFACLAMSAINIQVMRPLNAYFNTLSYIMRRFCYWINNCSIWLGLCTEEISLCLLVRDFRKLLKQQLGTIFGYFGKLKDKFLVDNSTTATTTSSTVQQLTPANSITVVNSSIVRVANALSTHPRTKTF